MATAQPLMPMEMSGAPGPRDTAPGVQSTPTHTHANATLATDSAATSAAPQVTWQAGAGTLANGSTRMYIFTFLATVIVLLVVAVCLLSRAVYVRRRYQRMLAAAAARGDTVLPQYESAFLPYVPRPVRSKRRELGPMPSLWDHEIKREDEAALLVASDEKNVSGKARASESTLPADWSSLTPVSLVTLLPPGEERPSTPPPIPVMPSLRAEFAATLRDMIPRRRREEREREHTATQGTAGAETQDATQMQTPAVAEPPAPGSDVRVGVLVAMPYHSPASWEAAPDGENDVPDVMLGVVQCVVEPTDQRSERPSEDRGERSELLHHNAAGVPLDVERT